MGAWSLHTDKCCVTSKLVAAAHGLGLRVFIFTVNELEEIGRMKMLGVDGVFSDFPERVV